MRKLALMLLPILLVALVATNSEAQLNRKSIKKNNKRISHFKGQKQGFSKDKKYNSLGISLNALNYYGDIAPKPARVSSDITFTRPGIGINFIHRFGPRYSLQGQFMYGLLKASDAKEADPNDENANYRYKRNLSFRNQIKELSVVGVVDLFKNEATYISRVKWTPYGYLGVAVFDNAPEAQAPATDLYGTPLPEAGQWVKLRKLGTEGQYSTLNPSDPNYGIKPYKAIQVAIPFGFGVRFRLNEVMDFWADIGYRYTFTDYIDDVSQDYVGLEKFTNPLAQAMSYRTNEVPGYPKNPVNTPSGIVVEAGYGHVNDPNSSEPFNMRGSKTQRDIYMVTSLRLTYILGATFHKAKFR